MDVIAENLARYTSYHVHTYWDLFWRAWGFFLERVSCYLRTKALLLFVWKQPLLLEITTGRKRYKWIARSLYAKRVKTDFNFTSGPCELQSKTHYEVAIGLHNPQQASRIHGLSCGFRHTQIILPRRKS